jgi:Carboxypeptidase regulatory-like domain/Bacterial Ig-like domain/Peptidase M15
VIKKLFNWAILGAVLVLCPFSVFADELKVTSYIPVTKTSVAGTKLYTYVYKVEVKNEGPALASLTATVSTTTTKQLTVIDGQSDFGPIPKDATVQSIDTITLQALKDFDKRLDPKDTKYPDSGSYGSEPFKLLTWKFTAATDSAIPVITAASPKDVVISSNKPIISAQYSDAGSGVDLTKVVLQVDAAIVTASSTITATGVSYTPTTVLADGLHTVILKVTDKVGNLAQTTWKFTVDTKPSVISAQTPKDVTVASATPTISASYADTGGAIDLTKVTLLLDGANVTAQAKITATGISYLPTTALSQGSHLVSLTVLDTAGNQTQSSWSFVVDNAPPVISAFTPKDISVAIATPLISAKFSDPSGIDTTKTKLVVDSVDVTSKIVTTADTISYQPTVALSQGNHTVALTLVDKGGRAVTANWSFQLDSLASVISGQSPKDTFLKTTTPTISAQYQDAGGIALNKVVLTVDSINVTPQAQVTATGITYLPTAPLAFGAHLVKLSVTDNAGNLTESSWSFQIDNKAVNITNPSPKDIAVNTGTPAITAQFTEEGSGVDATKTTLLVDTINVTSAAVITAAGISYQPAAILAAGTHTANLSVTDKAGNVSQLSWSFTVDSTGPSIANSLPANGAFVSSKPTISADFTDGTGVDSSKTQLLLDGAAVTPTTSTATAISYTPTQALAAGNHTVVLRVFDTAGNKSEVTSSFTVDAAGPIISYQVPVNGATVVGAPTISAQLADAGAGVDNSKTQLIVDGVDVSTSTTKSTTQISYTSSQNLIAGPHTVLLKTTDLVGNVSETTWSFSINGTGPAISNLAPADGASLPADALPTIKADFASQGSFVDASTVKLLVDGADVTASSQITPTSITYTPTQPLVEGKHTIKLLLKDKLGNLSEATWQFTTTTASVISGITPSNLSVITNLLPLIGADYSDVGSGVNLAKVALKVDGQDVTATASVNEFGISYLPTANMGEGAHTVNLMVVDNSGNSSEANWSFTVATPPTISSLTPANITLPPGSKPIISAAISDTRYSVDIASIKLFLDGADITSQAQVSASGVAFTPTSPLLEGAHTVYVTAANQIKASAQAVWSFIVDSQAVYNFQVLSPSDNAVVTTPKVEVQASGDSNKAFITEIILNGKTMPITADTTANPRIFALTIDLDEGINTLLLNATFSNGETKTQTTKITYDAPPRITITSPLDNTTFGPVSGTSPRDLTGAVERPVTITGKINKIVTNITVNQQQAALSGQDFRFDNFYLHEGINLLTAIATDSTGRTSSSSITVAVDQTAPFINVEHPLAGSITSASSIDIRGVVNDAVEGLTNSKEPIVTIKVGNGAPITAQVSDRYFLATNVPLKVGGNAITVTATDAMGNVRSSQINVTRVLGSTDRLTLMSGNNQKGPTNAQFAKPLSVIALGKDGNPIANMAVTFDILRGTGSISTQAGQIQRVNGAMPARNLVLNTDETGKASVYLFSGKFGGVAGNVVRASNPLINEEVLFVATSDKGLPDKVVADAGVNQYVQTGTQPLEPLTAIVFDKDDNRLASVPVTFTVEIGNALFQNNASSTTANGPIISNGGKSITVLSDKDGIAFARPTIGSTTGAIFIGASTIHPTTQQPIGTAIYTLQAREPKTGPTRFSGQVFDHRNTPLPGVRLSVGRTALSATSDATGQFSFDNVPPGKLDLFVDGRTATVQGQQYPSLHFESIAVMGEENRLPHPIHLPPLAMSSAKVVGGDQDVVITLPQLEGFKMTVKANSVTFPDGSRQGTLVVSPVNADKLPMPPPGAAPASNAPAWTIQPSGTRFDPPIEVQLPNNAQFLPGESALIYQWDHDLAVFTPMGRGTVSEDGAFIVSEKGSGITKAGWGCGSAPPPPPTCPKAKECKAEKCEDKQTVNRCPVCVPFDPELKITVSAFERWGGPNYYTELADKVFSATVSVNSKFRPTATTDIEWTIDKRSDKAGVKQVSPDNKKGRNISFMADNVLSRDGSYSATKPIDISVRAAVCNRFETVYFKQDEKDIIRQEYADFKEVPVMHTKTRRNTPFSLSPPNRSDFKGKGSYPGPLGNLNNPYQYTLGDPYSLATRVAVAYDINVKALSTQKLQGELAIAQSSALREQVQQRITELQTKTFYPTLNSVWRSPRHNYIVDGAARSNHLIGAAADLIPTQAPPNLTNNEKWCALKEAGGSSGASEVLLEINTSAGVEHSDHECTGNFSFNHLHVGNPG